MSLGITSGWINHFGIASKYQKYVDMNHWIRRGVHWHQKLMDPNDNSLIELKEK